MYNFNLLGSADFWRYKEFLKEAEKDRRVYEVQKQSKKQDKNKNPAIKTKQRHYQKTRHIYL
jgi:hypothetical protein